MRTRTFWQLLLLLPALHASPINPGYGTVHDPVQILSGTIGVTARNNPSAGLTTNANLITANGSLSGFSDGWVDFPGYSRQGTAASSFTIDPSLNWGSGDASMIIVYNGTSYSFQPRLLGSSPMQMWPATFQTPAVTLTGTGPLTFTVPFTVSMVLEWNNQFNGANAQFFQYYGSGTATLNFRRQIFAGLNDTTYTYTFDSATYAFASIPEPGTATLLGVTLALAWFKRRKIN